jgi:hypothetical protein
MQLDRLDQGSRAPRMPDADPPRRAVGARADHANVATEVDETTRRAGLPAQRREAVDRVLLDHPAEVDLHARDREAEPGRRPLHLLPSDLVEERPHLAGVRKLRAVEAPGAPQDAGCHVEQPAAGPEAGVRVVAEARRLVVDRETSPGCRDAVDLG